MYQSTIQVFSESVNVLSFAWILGGVFNVCLHTFCRAQCIWTRRQRQGETHPIVLRQGVLRACGRTQGKGHQGALALFVGVLFFWTSTLIIQSSQRLNKTFLYRVNHEYQRTRKSAFQWSQHSAQWIPLNLSLSILWFYFICIVFFAVVVLRTLPL